MSILLVIVGVTILTGLLATIRAIRTAPVAFEDGQGFHVVYDAPENLQLVRALGTELYVILPV